MNFTCIIVLLRLLLHHILFRVYLLVLAIYSHPVLVTIERHLRHLSKQIMTQLYLIQLILLRIQCLKTDHLILFIHSYQVKICAKYVITFTQLININHIDFRPILFDWLRLIFDEIINLFQPFFLIEGKGCFLSFLGFFLESIFGWFLYFEEGNVDEISLLGGTLITDFR